MAFLPGVVKAVLENEISHGRFEDFCVDLYSEVEGIELVPTSRTWDFGRDGRSVLLGMRGINPYLCATLRTDVDEKVESDIQRLHETSKTNCIVYCSSKELTEAKCDSIKIRIKELYPGLKDAVVLGQIQIVRLIERHETIFAQYYASEINSIKQALLLQPSTTPDIKEIGLLMALCTQATDDASELRHHISTNLILYTVMNQEPLKIEQLASYITGQLHLPRSLSPRYINEFVEKLRSDDYLTVDDNLIKITAKGKDFITCSQREEAMAKLFEGRIAIREAITVLSGHVLADMQYNSLWDVFQDGLTNIFYSHGLSIVRMVRCLLFEEETSPIQNDFYSHIKALASRSVSRFTNHEQAEEVSQALVDMFFEKDSSAFKWLTQICCIYVMMCSLGLEELSNQQILRVLSTYHVIPDTDIVISALCEGERNHEDVERILKGWRAIGGKVMAAIPVLEEVAYHAWISDYDYSNYGNTLNKMSDDNANHIIENAFVRAFRTLAGDKIAPKYWAQYIKQFRGSNEHDYSHVLQDLREEYGVDILPQAGDEYHGLASSVTDYLIKRISEFSNVPVEDIDYRTKDKLKRDGVLVANVACERHSRKSDGDFTTSCVLSSAGLLKEVDNIFRDQIGPPEMILSTAAISFLLTLAPQVSMSHGTLRSVLFDSALSVRLTQAQLYAFRVIAASGEFDVPWARRSALQRNLQDVLYQEARSKGEPVSSLRDKLTDYKDAEYSATIVAEALDRMAITSKGKEALIKARVENQKLREELQSLRMSKKMPRKSNTVPKSFKKRAK